MFALRPKNRRKSAAPGWRRFFAGGGELPWRTLAATVAAFGALTVLICVFVLVVDRPVRRIEAIGHFQRVTPAQIEQAVTAALAAHARTAGFLSIDLGAVRRSVEELDWVDNARVERRWPDGLRVRIVEQTPAARWGESGLLNTRGELFLRHARHIPPELPQLDGPPGSEWRVAQLYLKAQGRLLEAGVRISALTLDARGALELKLSNGIEVRFGRRQVEERLERFITAALPQIAGRTAAVHYVDMRYSNGFAIGWKADKRHG